MHTDYSELNCPQAIYGDGKVVKMDTFFLLLFLFTQHLIGVIFYDNQSNHFIRDRKTNIGAKKKGKKTPDEVGPEHMAWTLQAAELHIIEFDMPPDNRAALIWLVCCVSSRDVHCEIIEDEVLQPLVISSGMAQFSQRRQFW